MLPWFLVNLDKMTNSRHTMTAAQAKAQFAESLRHVERGDVVVITRYGRPVAALVGADELAQFERLRSRAPEDGLAKLISPCCG